MAARKNEQRDTAAESPPENRFTERWKSSWRHSVRHPPIHPHPPIDSVSQKLYYIIASSENWYCCLCPNSTPAVEDDLFTEEDFLVVPFYSLISTRRKREDFEVLLWSSEYLMAFCCCSLKDDGKFKSQFLSLSSECQLETEGHTDRQTDILIREYVHPLPCFWWMAG